MTVRMREADLTGVRCIGESLRDVEFAGARLYCAKLAACDLRGSDVSVIEPMRVELTAPSWRRRRRS